MYVKHANHVMVRMTIPTGFSNDGLLPPGDYGLTLEELRASWLVAGPGQEGYPHWDREWRARLVGNLSILVAQLWKVGNRGHFHRWIVRRGQRSPERHRRILRGRA